MPDKYTEFEYKNFVGLNSQDPAISIPKNMLAAGSQGFLIRSNALQPQPAITTSNGVVKIPGAPDGTAFYGIQSFIDSNNVVHTIGLTATNCYQLNSDLTWSLIGTIAAGNNAPYAMQVYKNKLYFSNGAILYFVDGLAGTGVQTASSISGGLFLSGLANSLIQAYTIEGSSIYPQRIRWSAPNQPTVWDPSVNPGAGFNDLDDLPDAISGFCVLGTYGYVFSPNNITVMSPTGNNQLPFTFDHLWYSQFGIGCAYPQSLDSYGATAAFMALDGVYTLTVSGLTNIGAPIIDELNNFIFAFTDFTPTQTFVFGKVIPVFAGPNSIVTNLMYNIYVSQSNGASVYTKVYSYSFSSKGWSSFISDTIAVTCKPNLVSIS